MQSNNLAKWFMTFVIWIVASTISIKALDPTGVVAGGQVLALVVISLLAALAGTFLLWGLPEVAKIYGIRAGTYAAETPEKGKRESRRDEQLALLMAMMDDEELQTLKEQLKQQVLSETGYEDGELPYSGETLAALLEDESADRRR